MKIFYNKRPDYKIFLYFLCINTLQENPTFRTIRSGPPDRLKQRPGVYIYNIRYENFCKKVVKNLHIVKMFSIFVMSERLKSNPDILKILKYAAET